MSRVKRLTVVLLLNLGLITALVIVGLAAHSLAVLAAGADYLADAAAIGVSLLAIWLASRPPSRARPHGYPNATNIAALVNAGWLLVLNIAIAAAAIQRLAEGTRPVEGLPVLNGSLSGGWRYLSPWRLTNANGRMVTTGGPNRTTSSSRCSQAALSGRTAGVLAATLATTGAGLRCTITFAPLARITGSVA